MFRNLLAQEALAQIPKILTLLDRNPHSATYGCFDRNYWQYKIIDFPSGMSQEFVWPLALVYSLDLPDNRFYQQPALRDWVEAGILYASRSGHPDGSCDDYFPFERAGGAAAFSLLACIESYALLGLDNSEILNFFQRRADWLAHHHESGQLTNHQALIVLCLLLLSRLLNTNQWEQAQAHRLERVLSWQNPEGWFQEYEGCDPGYHTLTISCLARINQMAPGDRLQVALTKAVDLAAHFVHPDGSYGGEYTSRNTYNFFPHGFELVGTPTALGINDRFLKGLSQGLGSCYADDHIIGHYTWNYLLAWRDFVGDRPPIQVPPLSSPPFPAPELIPEPEINRLWLPNARILIDQRQGYTLYLALNKGGVFKLFKDDQLVCSDTQFSLQVRQGKKLKNAVAHLVSTYDIDLEPDVITIQGNLGWAKQKQLDPVKNVVLRLVMLTVGRFFPNLIRMILQKLLITGKSETPYRFYRQFRWMAEEGKWQLKDELTAPDWNSVVTAGVGGDQTSISVAMSRTFQLGQLQPWLDLTPQLRQLSAGQSLHLDRQF